MVSLEFEYLNEGKSFTVRHHATPYYTVFTQYVIKLEIQETKIAGNVLL